MAKKAARTSESEDVVRTPSVEKSVARIAALIGLHLARDMNKQQQALLFTKAGFSAPDVAQMLDTGTNHVHAALSQIRKKGADTEKKASRN